MLNIVFCKYRNKKETHINLRFILFTMMILFGMQVIFNYFNYNFDTNIKGILENRKIIMFNIDEDFYRDLKKNDKIKEIYPLLENVAIEYEHRFLTASYLPDSEIANLKNLQIVDTNGVIIPSSIKNNSHISVQLNNEELTFKIKGTYECTKNCKIYTSLEKLQKLNTMAGSTSYPNSYTIITYEYDAVENLLAFCEEKGINASLEDSSYKEEINFYEKIVSFFNKAKIVMLIIVVTILFIIIKGIIESDKEDMNLLYKIGYHKNLIAHLSFLRTFFLLLTTIFVIAIIYSLITIILIILNFQSDYLQIFYLNNLTYLFIIFCFTTIVMYFINILFWKKVTIQSNH